MRFVLDFPGRKDSEFSEESVACRDVSVLAPQTFSGQTVVQLGTVTAKGDNGAEESQVLVFNSKTGKFRLYDVEGEASAFDKKSPDDPEDTESE